MSRSLSLSLYISHPHPFPSLSLSLFLRLSLSPFRLLLCFSFLLLTMSPLSHAFSLSPSQALSFSILVTVILSHSVILSYILSHSLYISTSSYLLSLSIVSLLQLNNDTEFDNHNTAHLLAMCALLVSVYKDRSFRFHFSIHRTRTEGFILFYFF